MFNTVPGAKSTAAAVGSPTSANNSSAATVSAASSAPENEANNAAAAAAAANARILPKSHIKRRLGEIAGKERHPDGFGTFRWVVKSEFIEKYSAQVDDIMFTPKVKKTKTPSAKTPANKSNPSSASKASPLKRALFQDELTESAKKKHRDNEIVNLADEPNDNDDEVEIIEDMDVNDNADGEEEENEIDRWAEGAAPTRLFEEKEN